MECGLVLERLLGGGVGAGGLIRRYPGGYFEDGGGRLRHATAADDVLDYKSRLLASGPLSFDGGDDDGGGGLARAGEELIRDVLDVYGLDNAHTRERVLYNFRRIFSRRVGRAHFRSHDVKTAAAFSLCNQLTRLQSPRPPVQLCSLCEVNSNDLLDIPRRLRFSEEEKRVIPRELYELKEAAPHDYVDGIGAAFGIPFSTTTYLYGVAEESRWALHGRQPTVIAAAAIAIGLRELGEDWRVDLNRICVELGCSAQSGKRAVESLARFRRGSTTTTTKEEKWRRRR